jgi:HPt (histidine-containing phosphotransfer) domain-containing protein
MINQELVAAIAARSGVTPSEVLAAFRESTAQDMIELRGAASVPDAALVALHAHRLRGASEMLGAGKVGQAARLLEECAARGREDSLRDALAALESEVHALEARLRALGADDGDRSR